MPSQSGTVRRAVAADLAAIVRIYNQAVDDQRTADMDHVDVAARAEWLAAHGERHPIFVFEDDRGVHGWLSISEYRPGRRALRGAAEVSYYVDYGSHKRGVGTSMMQAAIEHSQVAAIDTLFAILLEDNEASIALLEKHGFVCWGRLPRVADFDGRRVGQVYYGRHIVVAGTP